MFRGLGFGFACKACTRMAVCNSTHVLPQTPVYRHHVQNLCTLYPFPCALPPPCARTLNPRVIPPNPQTLNSSWWGGRGGLQARNSGVRVNPSSSPLTSTFLSFVVCFSGGLFEMGYTITVMYGGSSPLTSTFLSFVVCFSGGLFEMGYTITVMYGG